VATAVVAAPWSRDASEDIAHELELRINAGELEVSDARLGFIESHTGRRIGAQLPLPLA
jgi:hypothetical protein